MQKRHKDILRPLVAELRRTLAGSADGSVRGDLDRELERLGIAPDGTITSFDALPNPSRAEERARVVAEAELATVTSPSERASARAAFVERAAYGHINRLLALRVLEARGLIDETLRANPDYQGLPEALHLLRTDDPRRAAGPDGGWWAVVEDACNALAASLPGLFSPDSRSGPTATLHDPAIALRPSARALIHCIALLGGGPSDTRKALDPAALDDLDAAFADPDAIGWAYQFYQEEAKAQVYLRLKGGRKVTSRDEIAAATQLFTEPYMVKWLLQNSLGRSYHEAYPDSALPATWEYYIRPDVLDVPAVSSLEGLTLLDPCMGSGHFLREAFDMFVAMYRERQPGLSAVEIADRVLAEHLHGIDLDPRAAQLAAFTLYARAWELVRDERRATRMPGPGTFTPAAMSLATTPDRIAPGALARHLQRHPEDRILEPFLDGVFAALEQADTLGSLLRPRAHLAPAIAELRNSTMRLLEDPDEQELQRVIVTMVGTDPTALEDLLLNRAASGFAAEARGTDDVAAALFGRAGERGARLLQVLDRQYAVVVTNPPYMGSKNMETLMLRYVERHYPSGKRDLYAAFILRNLDLAGPGGRVAMVTQQSWMFLSSYAGLRAVPEEELATVRARRGFTGLLRETSLETLAHLGSNAFEEISGEVVQCALFVTARHLPASSHTLTALRLVGIKSPVEKATVLRQGAAEREDAKKSGMMSHACQLDLLSLPGTPIAYWMQRELLSMFQLSPRFSSILKTKQGIVTGNNDRFLRVFWEVGNEEKYDVYLKGLGYAKWYGFTELSIRWDIDKRKIAELPVGRAKAPEDFIRNGWSYSSMARGCMSPREYISGWKYDNRGPVIFPSDADLAIVGSILASNFGTNMLRYITQGNDFNSYHIDSMPIWRERVRFPFTLTVKLLVDLAKFRASQSLTDRYFSYSPSPAQSLAVQRSLYGSLAYSLTLEALQEHAVHKAYGLENKQVQLCFEETGTPSGFFPLLIGYDALPPLADRVALDANVRGLLASHLGSPPPTVPTPQPDAAILRQPVGIVVPEEVRDCICLAATILPRAESPSLRSRLRTMYEAGPRVGVASEGENEDEGTTEPTTGTYLPIPVESFLEELSQRLQIHPISIYWLLEELHTEGARCKPEEQRLLEDRLSVLVLRLFGHRWPKQLEAGEPVPEWADRDGIIPLLPGTGEATLADRLRERLRAEDGDLGAQQAEALLQELTGLSLETWLRRAFFPRHVRQFKYRPIAWQLASNPTAGGSKRKGGGKLVPAFECLVYAHRGGRDLLARIRTQYVTPLLNVERARRDAARQGGDDTAAALATARVQELERFAEALRGVEEHGFAFGSKPNGQGLATDGLDALLAAEPLDRWSGDGLAAPTDRDDLLARERAWHADINDGVRVNVAPLQLAGLLLSEILKEPDARKAIVDRARWRADERRWVREGVLPRCGWMPDEIPESPRWTERAPERAAEAAQLARKRAEALAKLEHGDDR